MTSIAAANPANGPLQGEKPRLWLGLNLVRVTRRVDIPVAFLGLWSRRMDGWMGAIITLRYSRGLGEQPTRGSITVGMQLQERLQSKLEAV